MAALGRHGVCDGTPSQREATHEAVVSVAVAPIGYIIAMDGALGSRSGGISGCGIDEVSLAP